MTETTVSALMPQYAEEVMSTPAIMIGIQMLQLHPFALRKVWTGSANMAMPTPNQPIWVMASRADGSPEPKRPKA